MTFVAETTSCDVAVNGTYVSSYTKTRYHKGGVFQLAPDWPYYHAFCGWGFGVQLRVRQVSFNNDGTLAYLSYITDWAGWDHTARGTLKTVAVNAPAGYYIIEAKHGIYCTSTGAGPTDIHPAAYQGSSMHIPTLKVYYNK